MNYLNIKLFTFTLCFIFIYSKYNTQPSYSFSYKSQTSGVPLKMYLSGDSSRIALISYQFPNLYFFHQDIYYIDQQKLQCTMKYNTTLSSIGFPSKTNLVYLDDINNQFIKMTQPCGNPQKIVQLKQPQLIKFYTIGSTANESFIALRVDNIITEYNIETGQITGQYQLLVEQIFSKHAYSSKRTILWVEVLFEGKIKLIAFNTSNIGHRENEFIVQKSHNFYQGNNKGDSYLYTDGTGCYRVDENGNKQLILNLFIQFIVTGQSLLTLLGMCTNDDLLLVLKNDSNTSKLVTYNSENGSEIQNIQLGFISGHFPDLRRIQCNDKFLVFIDQDIKFQVFQYKRQQPTPNPDGDNNKIPTWVIILIAVGGLLIIGGIIGFVIYKKKKSKKSQSYTKFDQQSTS